MKLVDVHAHLESERFGEDLDGVVKRAENVGVKIIINSGTDSNRNKECLNLSKKYPIIKCSFGWYPVGNSIVDVKKEIKWIESHKNECWSIGEIGLDYMEESRDLCSDKQKEMFRQMIRLAKKLKKPVVIHSRKAEKDALEVLEEEGVSKVIMHCFSGNVNLIKRAMNNGYYFSIPAVITRLQHFQTLVSIVPIEQLLTETDSPYLSPIAGERSEPKDVFTTIKEIAKIKKLSEEEVASHIWDNYEKVFLEN